MSVSEQQIRDLQGTLERRGFTAHLELREHERTLRFTGYASTTEVPYEVSDFTETIARGAFKRTLDEDPDVVFLINHEGLPLARTTSGTLELEEDDRGLRVNAELDPSDPDVRTIRPKLARGDLSQMSFAFRVTTQSWNENRTKRLIRGVSLDHGDVSIVTMGANPTTEASLRSQRLQGHRLLLNHTTRAQQDWELAALQSGVPIPRIALEDSTTRRQRAQLAAFRR